MVADDHPLVIEGLKAILTDADNISFSYACSNGPDVLKHLSGNKADVLLLDVNLPDIKGTELCLHITKNYLDTKVLGLSTFNEQSIIKEMIKNGVRGYILKNAPSEELVSAITLVYNGELYFSREVQKILANALTDGFAETIRLTRREKLILSLIADGKTTSQIAEDLFISPLTVETHRRNLMKKLNVSNAAAMVKLALEKKLL